MTTDDHAEGSYAQGRPLVGWLVACLIRKNELPILVCLPAEGSGASLSLNEVVDDRSLYARAAGKVGAHLTRRSVAVLSPELREAGEVRLGDACVRLFAAPSAK
jgi:hypothetical protein